MFNSVEITSLTAMVDILVSSSVVAWSDEDYQIANALNQLSGNVVDIETIDRISLQKATDLSEVDSLTDSQKYNWQLIMNNESLPVRDQTIRNQVLNIWGPGTNTRSNFAALQQVESTFAEDALNRQGVNISHQDITIFRLEKFGE